MSKTNQNVVKVTYVGKVTKEQIYASLDKLFELNGCLACGLNGYGINLTIDEIINPGDREFVNFQRSLIADEKLNIGRISLGNEMTQLVH